MKKKVGGKLKKKKKRTRVIVGETCDNDVTSYYLFHFFQYGVYFTLKQLENL